jgi:hypothetical protein
VSRHRWQETFLGILDDHAGLPVLAAAEAIVERPLTRSEYESARRAARNLDRRWLVTPDGELHLLVTELFRGRNVDGREQPTLYLLRVPADIAPDPDAVGAFWDDLGLEPPRPTVRAVAKVTGFPRSTVGRYLAGRPDVGTVPNGTDATTAEAGGP